jgi:hypothetical protein
MTKSISASRLGTYQSIPSIECLYTDDAKMF